MPPTTPPASNPVVEDLDSGLILSIIVIYSAIILSDVSIPHWGNTAPYETMDEARVKSCSGDIVVSMPPTTPPASNPVVEDEAKDRRSGWWHTYNYITAAGLDSGLILSIIVIYSAIILSDVSSAGVKPSG
jgi:hypothetical protein